MNDEYKKMLERFEQICQNAKKELCGKKEKEQEKRFIEKIDKELTISEYDEIEYWLANVEILDNTDYILNNRKAKILVRYLKEKQQEIERLNNIIEEYKNANEYHQKIIHELETMKQPNQLHSENVKLRAENNRLNNIINELEKWLEEQHQFIIEIPAYTKEIAQEHKTMELCYESILDKLQELKGSDDDSQDECEDFDKIVFSDDLEKYRQVNGYLNDKGNKIFCQRVNNYLDKKGSDKE